MTLIVNAVYFAVAILFILGLKAMSSPVTARRGIMWAGVGMVLATVVTFLYPAYNPQHAESGLLFFGPGKSVNLILTVVAIAIGGGVAWWAGKVVKMTDMPQMVAVYNGMGGGAAALIAAVEFARATSGEALSPIVASLAVLGALIGSVAFAGSIIAFLKLQGIMKKTWRLPAQNLD